ncbi:MAG: multidrug transporter [Acetatifactor sp.]
MSRVQGVNERDWKLFRSKLPDWQENYMDKLNHEYMEILNGDGNPSDRFWALEERIRKDKRDTGVVVRGASRSNMLENILALIREGAIGVEDLAEFSEELRETVKMFVERNGV